MKDIRLGSAWKFFIEKRAIAWLFIIGATLFGIFSYSTLPREIQPEINIPYAIVSSYLPGASSLDTESLLTEPLEKEVGSVSGIKKMSSTSSNGMSLIIVEFDTSIDTDKGVADIKSAVDKIKSSLPTDAIEPSVMKTESNSFSVITYSLMGDLPVSELTKIAKDVQAELEKVSGVSSADIIGGLAEQVTVTLDPKKVEAYGLDMQTVATLIKYSSTNFPLGVVSLDRLNYSIRVDNRYQTIEDIRNIPLFSISSTPILLKDIAKVEKGYPEQNVLTKISVAGKKSLPAVSLQVFKKEGGNILEIVDATKIVLDKLQKDGTIPKEVEVAKTNDNSDFIREDLGVLTKSGLETTVLIILILFLALGFRQGLIAGISVPLTFLMSFTVMSFMGLTINSLSLFGLVIALGIAVDVSIVIMQGIHKNAKMGMSMKDATLSAIHTYRYPLLAGTFTTVFAFFPMLLVSGIVGEFLKTLPIVITTSLLSALFLGFTITPSLSVKYLREDKIRTSSFPLEKILDKTGKKFRMFIEAVVEKRFVRVISLLIVIVLFGLSMSLPLSGILPVEMFPQTNQNYFIINIETPKGVIVEDTAKVVEKIEARLRKIPEVENFVEVIGSNQSVAMTEGIMGSGVSESSNLSTITVNLINKHEREVKSFDLANQLEEEFKNVKEAKVTIQQLSEGPPSGASINIKVMGKDLEELKKLSTQVQDATKSIPGTKNVETSLTQGLNEFNFQLDRDKLAYHGLSGLAVAANIRNILQGIDATQIKIDNEDVDVIVKYDLPKRGTRTNLTLHDIENFEIQSPKGYKVSLSELGKYSFGESPDTIEREDQKRVIKISAETTKDANSVAITTELQAKIDQMELPAGYEINFGGDYEEITKSFNDLFKSMIVGLILIAACLVLEFNSFKQSFVILLSLPMGLIGVFPGLYLLGLNLSFPAFLGVIALAGIVVNHAIVLFDRINENRRNKMRFPQAIAEAAHSRFEPIFITTLTAVIGTFPLALSNEFWAGLGFALIWGLAFSTLLTLVTLPIIYYTFELRGARKNGEI